MTWENWVIVLSVGFVFLAAFLSFRRSAEQSAAEAEAWRATARRHRSPQGRGPLVVPPPPPMARRDLRNVETVRRRVTADDRGGGDCGSFLHGVAIGSMLNGDAPASHVDHSIPSFDSSPSDSGSSCDSGSSDCGSCDCG